VSGAHTHTHKIVVLRCMDRFLIKLANFVPNLYTCSNTCNVVHVHTMLAGSVNI
jgi:hypothetical protein